MDQTLMNEDQTREQVIIAAKKRFESFQFRRAAKAPNAPSLPALPPVHSHSRSHSRSTSITSLTLSNSANSNTSLASETSTFSNSRPSSISSRPRPTSHHRRRSSVSTRAESADMMGVTLPELPPSSSEDSLIFGDKDSIRRRALLALEGKSDFDSESGSVEIPHMESPSVECKPFEFPGKPSQTPSPSPFGISNSFSGKRDSFGKLLTPASSLKDQLHTLLEEEEEDGEEEIKASPANLAVGHLSSEPLETTSYDDTAFNADESELSSTPSASAPMRRRPTNLVLRPLSLTPTVVPSSLPTPSLTPSPRNGGLKSRALAPVNSEASPSTNAEYKVDRTKQSVVLTPSPSPVNVASLRHQSLYNTPLPLTTANISSESPTPKRQSSISYIRSSNTPTPPLHQVASLPTPGATPTTEKRLSMSSSVSDTDSSAGRERPLSLTEQSFLHHSHATLLARITELERTLHTRPSSRSRTASAQSNCSVTSSEPSDEMLRLVADLKSERDDLMRDVECWRQRNEGLERAKDRLEFLVETERKEASLKAEKLGLSEAARDDAIRQLNKKDEELDFLLTKVEEMKVQLTKASQDRDAFTKDLENMKGQLTSAQLALGNQRTFEEENKALRDALLIEKKCREALESQLESAGMLNTPTPNSVLIKPANMLARSNGLGFTSIDSEGSFTDVESSDDFRSTKGPFTLRAVEEEPEDCDGNVSEEDNGLAGYEDEDDSDISLQSPGSLSASSSFDGDLPRSTSHLQLASITPSLLSANPSPSPSPSPSPCPTPVPTPAKVDDARPNRASLSKTWTFPRGSQPLPSPNHELQTVDRFFGCLEDVDDSPPALHAVNKLGNKDIFSQSLQFMDDGDEEDMPPFVIPAQPGDCKMPLDVVLEEDEEEDMTDGEAVDGGVMFSFPISVNNESSTHASSARLFDQDFPTSESAHSCEEEAYGGSKPRESRLQPQIELRSPATPLVVTKRIPVPTTSVHASTRNAVTPHTETKVSSPSPSPVKMGFSFPNKSHALVTPPSNRSVPVAQSRIPPPSPPKFATPIQQKTSIPSPHREPIPVAMFTRAPKAESRLSKTNDAHANLPKKALNSTPSRPNSNINGSTLIPQLKSSQSTHAHFLRVSAAADERTDNLTRSNLPTPAHVTGKTFDVPWVPDVLKPTLPSSRLSFRTFTNLIPLSWSPRHAFSTHDNDSVNDQETLAPPANTDDRQRRDTCYVPKEKQLAKLKARMAEEYRIGTRVGSEVQVKHCGRCNGDLVSL